MEIEGCQEFDLEFEADDLIDNDLFPETLDAGIDVNDHLPEVHKSSEPERNQRKGRCNVRQSLAWDNAFFTNAGVLDAEELSNIISGSVKKKTHMLPGIQEDIAGSTESISTLQSDSLTLETLDDDLFLDIRASIQRTRASKKAPQLTNSSSKMAPMELDRPSITSPKKEDFVPKNKNQVPGVKKSGPQTVRMSKSQLKPIGTVASGRPIKQGSVQSQNGSVRKTGETKPVLPKPLKTVSSSVPSVAAKPESVGTGRVKPECGSSKQGSVSVKGSQLPKVSALGGSRKVLPKPAVSLKSSSLGSSSIRSSTSSGNSISTASGNAKKPLMTARRNLGKSNNTITNSSSILKNPSRAVPNNKLPGTTLLSHPKSTKIPKSVSPASSISEWSSVSSSTSSVINRRCSNSRTSIDTSSCRSVDDDPRKNPPDQKAQRQRNLVAISTSCTLKRPSTESGTLQDPTKPSGLRLPSSRIGFFDGSSSRTPNGRQHPQSALRPGLPKNGAGTSTPTRSSNGKLKNPKFSTARKATSPPNIKPGSPKTASSPVSSQEKSHISSVSMDVNDSSTLSLGVKGCRIEETCQKKVEVKAENNVEQVVDEGTVATDKDNIGSLSLSKNLNSGDTETNATEGGDSSISKHVTVKGSRIEETCPKPVEIKAENGVEQVVATVAVDKDNLCGLNLSKNMNSGDTETNATEVGDSSISELIGIKGSRIKETCQKLEEVKAEYAVEQVVDAGTDAVEKDNLCVLSLNTNMNSSDTETAAGEDGRIEDTCQEPVRVKPENGVEQVMDEVMSAVGKDSLCGLSLGKNMNSDDTETAAGEGGDSSSSELIGVKGSRIEETCQKPEEVKAENGFEQVVDERTGAVDKDKLRGLSSSKNMNSADAETAAGEGGDSSRSELINQTGDSILIKKDPFPASETTEKENGPANYQGEGLSSEKRSMYQKNFLSECVLSSDSEAAAYRPPFALKNSCSEEFLHKPAEVISQVAVAVTEDAGFALPFPEEKENS